MNKNYLHKSLAALLAAAALTGCAKDKEEFHYIDLSQVACTFQGEDNQPLTVSVITAPAAWSAAPEASWVTAEKGQDGESLTITVEDNTYIVEGKWLERLMSNVNFGDYESRMFFDKMLRENGVFQQLEDLGIKDGDIVSMYELEFEYQH